MTRVDFLLVAISLAAFAAIIIYSGRIQFRERIWADRSADPGHFWVCVVAISLASLASFSQFLFGALQGAP